MVLLFLYESSTWVEIMLHTEYQLSGYPGSDLKVCGGVGTKQLHCHSNLSCVGLSWAVTKIATFLCAGCPKLENGHCACA